MIDDVVTVVVRIALALAFGAVIGIEREWRQKHAGLKTMTLVAVGAAGFAMMSDTFGPNNHNPAQIAAMVVTGIGFIGAGVIMHRGVTVQGVTTAATLWADASMGVAIGLGHYPLAITLTAAIVLVQLMFRKLETLLLHVTHREKPGRVEVRVDCSFDAVEAIDDRLSEILVLIPMSRSIQRGADHVTLRTMLRATEPVDLVELEKKLVALGGVRRVDVRHVGYEED